MRTLTDQAVTGRAPEALRALARLVGHAESTGREAAAAARQRAAVAVLSYGQAMKLTKRQRRSAAVTQAESLLAFGGL